MASCVACPKKEEECKNNSKCCKWAKGECKERVQNRTKNSQKACGGCLKKKKEEECKKNKPCCRW
eukprot:CAMPEP_0172505740 /NCGR_PEP_ID=MMETSP1066-20121228/188680_1 /TAXON_ID=671091 /ORGANISM="Coscinodiscus wailesii, Strain CCMP2513" /LENGTH=64 /DNA_ID=CAMNT_0013282471 /DNA_START=301 /DNA_END=492 /DNA_ORIENTATION=+